MKRGLPNLLSLFAILVATVGLVLFYLWFTRPMAQSHGEEFQQAESISSSPGDRTKSVAQDTPSAFSTDRVSAGISSEAQLTEFLRAFLEDLKTGLSVSQVKARREALQTGVHALPPDAAAAAIIAQLQSGEDAATGLGFVVGSEGIMAETPTYRTELLNLLGQTDPFQASDYARVLMKESLVTPDEYALSLRNLAWADLRGNLRDDLRSFFARMLDRPEWRANPTAGFLEAFDVAAFTESSDLVAKAIEPAGTTDIKESLVSRAGFVALDRIMLSNRSAVLDAFQQNPDFLSHAPFHRASILSRLDPRQPAEAQLLENYLLRSDHAPGELAYFAEIYPNGNRFISHRLVTSWERGGSIMEVAQMDKVVLHRVRLWLEDPRFGPRRDELTMIAKRLEEFLGSVSSQ
jgi:hypothetical protein